MKPRLLGAFLLIVVVPIVLLGWMGTRVARNERELVRQRFRELLERDLADIAGSVSGYVQDVENRLSAMMEVDVEETVRVRGLSQNLGTIHQAFLLDASGDLLYPNPSAATSEKEKEFLERTREVFEDKEILNAAPVEGAGASTSNQGWQTWYWGNGLRLLFWRRSESGNILGCELNRARFIADLIGVLPETDSLSPDLRDARVVLEDSEGDALYQWGIYEIEEGDNAAAALSLDPPLGSWKLRYFVSGDLFGNNPGRGFRVSFTAATVATVAVLLALAVYFYRESSREIREASQRVSFVNQVSHELKTPLTNVRMYAELLEQNLEEVDDKTRDYLNILVAESQRLSRLIGNILTFSRKSKTKLLLHRAPGIVDRIMEEVLTQFGPSLNGKGIEIQKQLDAKRTVQVDRDVVEQILGNLIGNVEKYASKGGMVRIETENSEGMTRIAVQDNGPGIPPKERKRIFSPFYRIQNSLTEGVTGTGIGLAIARDLARLHGGDLILEDSERGARFLAVLATPEAPEGGEP